MANIHVDNTTANTRAAKRARYEKMEKAYGKILAANAGVTGDVLIFSKIPSRNIIHVALVAGTVQKEFFYGTDFSAALTFNHLTGGAKDIYYTVEYIRGTGKIDDATSQAGEGELLKITNTFAA